jgi:hypothetical protein
VENLSIDLEETHEKWLVLPLYWEFRAIFFKILKGPGPVYFTSNDKLFGIQRHF